MSLWAVVERLVDEATDPAALQAHGLHLVAARRWRTTGRVVPAAWSEAERIAAVIALATPSLLTRIRSVLPGPILLLKGAEIAARYPDPLLRPFGDLDVLVPDAQAAERALHEAGFLAVEGETAVARPQHQPPLGWPRSPLPVELHHALPMPAWADPPLVSALIATSAPSATNIDGIETLSVPGHAVLLAAHAWLHYGPRFRVRDLIDVAVMVDGLDPAEVADVAKAWGLWRVWATTMAAVNRLDGQRGADLREPSLADEHLVRWAGALWAPSRRSVPRALAQTIERDLQPWPGELWPARLTRLRRAVPHALRSAAAYRTEKR